MQATRDSHPLHDGLETDTMHRIPYKMSGAASKLDCKHRNVPK